MVLYQNCTVGKNHGAATVRGDGVATYPHSAVIGGCLLRIASTLSQGVSVVSRDTPGDCPVFQSNRGGLSFAQPKNDTLADVFRDLPAPQQTI